MSSASIDPKVRRLNLMRYGLMVIPVVAWAVSFAYLFLVSNAFSQNWIGDAMIPSLTIAVIVGVVCAAVYYGYKRFVLNP